MDLDGRGIEVRFDEDRYGLSCYERDGVIGSYLDNDVNFGREIVDIIFLIKQDIEATISRPIFIKNRDLGWVRDDNFLRKIAEGVRGPADQREKKITKILRERRRKVGKKFESQDYRSAMIENLLLGNSKMALLLDSPGGYVDIAQQILSGLRAYKKLDGEVRIFVRNEAASAGFWMFMQGNGRYVLRNSELLFHLEDFGFNPSAAKHHDYINHSNIRKKDTKIAAKSMEELKEFLEDHVKEKYLKTVLKNVEAIEEDDENLDNTWELTGAEATRLGVADKSFRSVKAMRGFFKKQFRGALKIKEVDAFFK